MPDITGKVVSLTSQVSEQVTPGPLLQQHFGGTTTIQPSEGDPTTLILWGGLLGGSNSQLGSVDETRVTWVVMLSTAFASGLPVTVSFDDSTGSANIVTEVRLGASEFDA